MAVGIAWPPTRAPSPRGGPLTAAPRGLRLLLRWLTLVVTIRAGIVILAPALILFVGDAAFPTGNRAFPFPIQPIIRVCAIVAGCFLVVALSELTHRGHVIPPRPGGH